MEHIFGIFAHHVQRYLTRRDEAALICANLPIDMYMHNKRLVRDNAIHRKAKRNYDRVARHMSKIIYKDDGAYGVDGTVILFHAQDCGNNIVDRCIRRSKKITNYYFGPYVEQNGNLYIDVNDEMMSLEVAAKKKLVTDRLCKMPELIPVN